MDAGENTLHELQPASLHFKKRHLLYLHIEIYNQGLTSQRRASSSPFKIKQNTELDPKADLPRKNILAGNHSICTGKTRLSYSDASLIRKH